MTTRPRAKRTIREAKRGLSRRLLQHPGVSGVGVTAAANGDERITIYLAEDSAALRALVPPTVEGYPTAVEIVGRITARDGAADAAPSASAARR